VTFVRADTLTVVRVPDIWGVVFGTGEEEISISVVLEESERPLVPFQQDRPHSGRTRDGTGDGKRSRFGEEEEEDGEQNVSAA
jgi:hypothetical protein